VRDSNYQRTLSAIQRMRANLSARTRSTRKLSVSKSRLERVTSNQLLIC
jgi:hypothetical protein